MAKSNRSKTYSRPYYAKNRERILAKCKRRYRYDRAFREVRQSYREKNREIIRIKEKAHYWANRERILAKLRHRYRTDPALRAYQRRYEREHPEARIRYRKKNRKIINAKARAYYRAKRTAKGPLRWDPKHPGLLKRGRYPIDPQRARAMRKLRRGKTPLTPQELKWVLPNKRAKAKILKPRTLEAVAELFGLRRRRVGEIISRLRDIRSAPTRQRAKRRQGARKRR
ncbi:MAG TPA: hypothetical protein VGZ47_17090 [Gemmataceae bacterium]|nr:hypothetical protein [Gemmataceae bacterium]